jgi:sialate O-acetylesterase
MKKGRVNMKMNPFPRIALLLLSAVVLATPAVRAATSSLRLADIFDDHMVLQRDQAVKVWGWAAPRQKVTVSFAGKTTSVTAASDGSWLLELPPMPANASGRELAASCGSEQAAIQDVLVGDVWLLGGQSNMQMPLWWRNDGMEKVEGKRLALHTDHDWLRIMTVPQRATRDPQDGFPKDITGPNGEVNGRWFVSQAGHPAISTFSSLGYYIGVRLHEKVGVPIGLVDTAWGGTLASLWCSREQLEQTPEATEVLAEWDAKVAEWTPEQAQKQYALDIADWENRVEAAKAAKAKRLPKKPELGIDPQFDKYHPAGCFNAMILPIRHLSIRGAMFFQGENNVFDQTRIFEPTFRGVVDTWRDAFGRKDLPFCIFQIAGWGPKYQEYAPTKIVHIQEAQKKVHLSRPDTGFVVTADHTHSDIHPLRKKPLADRAVRWALAEVYGQKEISWGDPVVTGTETKGGRLLLHFRTPGGEKLEIHSVPMGFVLSEDGTSAAVETSARNEELPVAELPTGFVLAGADRKFVPAQAEVIDGTTVAVWAESVPEPVAVRYAWSPRGFFTLYTESGLPAGPFRTDDWDFLTDILEKEKKAREEKLRKRAAQDK